MVDLIKIKEEINLQLGDKETFQSLVETTFKGLPPTHVKRALMEGMMRGFQFKDFLEKNIYAVPFSSGYALVTSIDYARKIGMRSGVVGKSAPLYEMDGEKIVSCTITIKRKVSDYIGEYSATVFFNEFSTGKNLWSSKPRIMIAKVAEAHALRMACPEEMAQFYVEEEYQQKPENIKEPVVLDLTELENKLRATTSLSDLKKIWADLPVEAKKNAGLKAIKEEVKQIHENTKI